MSRIFSPNYVRRVKGAQGAYRGGWEDREPPKEMFLPSTSTLYRTDGTRTGRRIGSPHGARQAGAEKISFQPKISGRIGSLHSPEKISFQPKISGGAAGGRGDPFLARMERGAQGGAGPGPAAEDKPRGNWVEWSGGQVWMPHDMPKTEPLIPEESPQETPQQGQQPPPYQQLPQPYPQAQPGALPWVPGAPSPIPPLPEVPQAWLDKSRQDKADYAGAQARTEGMFQAATRPQPQVQTPYRPPQAQVPYRPPQGAAGGSGAAPGSGQGQGTGGGWGSSLFGRLAHGVDTALNSSEYRPVVARAEAIQTTLAQRRAAENAGAASQMAKGPLYDPETARLAVRYGQEADATAGSAAASPKTGASLPGVPISNAGLGLPPGGAAPTPAAGRAGAPPPTPAASSPAAPAAASSMAAAPAGVVAAAPAAAPVSLGGGGGLGGGSITKKK